jgi:hypothetical protein
MNSKRALERALRALESDRKQLENRTQKLGEQIAGLRSILGRSGRLAVSGARRRSRKRKPMTTAQKKQISAAMKKAWARRKR